ncbi:transporter associated domain-containing protein, partial [Acinetobacter baumannii]
DDEEEQIQRTEEGLLVDGRASLDDVAEELGTELASESFDTIGGYVFGLFGRQPAKGEAIQDSGFRFIVADTDGRRIHRLAIVEAPQEIV